MAGQELDFRDNTPAAASGYQLGKFQKGPTSGTDPTFGLPIFPLSVETPASGSVLKKTANYTAAAGDCGMLVSFALSGAATYTLPATPPSVPDGGGTNRWKASPQNSPTSTAALTVAATTPAKLDGVTAGTLVLGAATGVNLYTDGTDYFTERGASSGGVTSVGLTMPGEFSVSGSPVTSSGTLAVTKANQSANAVYAGPSSGSAAAPTFRSLAPADLPVGSASQIGGVQVDGTSIVAAAGVISTTGTPTVKAVYTGNNANGGTNSGGSPASGSFTTTKGNAILVFAAFNGTPSAVGFTDTQGNTYQLVANYAAGNTYVYAALNVAGGTGNVITGVASGVTFWGFQAMEYTNVVGASPLDTSGTSSGTGVPVTSSVTTANASDVLISFGFVFGGSGWTYSWTNSFVQEVTSNPASGINLAVADLNVSATGTYSTAFSRSSGGSATSYHLLVALRVSTGVQDFNGRTGHVLLNSSDVAAVLTAAAVAGVGAPTSLTTVGSSGNATLSAGVLNIPNYGAGAGGAYTKLSETILGSASSSVTFSGISGSYRNLYVTIMARSSASPTTVNVQFNGDTGSNYSFQGMFSQNTSTPGSYSAASGTSFGMNSIPGSAAPAGQAGSIVFYVLNYAGTTFWKNVIANGYRSDGSSVFQIDTAGGSWHNTAALTSITLTSGSGNFIAGSVFTLYGIS